MCINTTGMVEEGCRGLFGLCWRASECISLFEVQTLSLNNIKHAYLLPNAHANLLILISTDFSFSPCELQMAVNYRWRHSDSVPMIPTTYSGKSRSRRLEAVGCCGGTPLDVRQTDHLTIYPAKTH